MLCSTCHIPIENGIEVFQKTWKDLEEVEKPEPSYLCANCVIGWNIPVFRPQERTWEFGVVESYKEDTREHYVRFIEDDGIWISIETDTFARYLGYSTRILGEPGDQDQADRLSTSEKSFEFELDPIAMHESGGDILSLLHGEDTPRAVLEIPPLQHHASPARKRQKLAHFKDDTESVLACGEAFMFGQEEVPILLVNTTPTKASGTAQISTPQPTTPLLVESTRDAPKQFQRMWSPKEDNMLLDTVAANRSVQLKWPQIARMVPGRSGKQCRERYMNHLKPSLKLASWSTWEDAMIFHLFAKQGSKWAMMSKLISGRTDNSIKNRYHHLKRRFEKRVQSMCASAPEQIIGLANELSLKQRMRSPDTAPRGEFGDFLWKYVAIQIIRSRDRRRIEGEQASSFGPWRKANPLETCRRCGLFVPSAQTGSKICTSSGWCETCSQVSSCLSGSVLRTIHAANPTSRKQSPKRNY